MKQGHDHGGHDAPDEHGHSSTNDHGGAPSAADHGHSHGGVIATIRGVFAPHGHDAADSIDDALASSAKGIRAVKISLGVLLATALVQIALVFVTGSVALLADTIHNFADALTAVPLWMAFVLGRRAATRRYTYGFGRTEDLAGLFILAMIVLSAVVAGLESVNRLLHPQPVSNLPVLIAAGLVGFVGNELVAVYRTRTGKAIGSAALVADGYHARTDGLTSLAVVFGAVGVGLGFPAADPIVGLGITAVILWVLKGAVGHVFERLLDSVEPATIDRIERVARSVTGVRDVGDVRARWNGHRLEATLHATIDCTMSVSGGHAIAEAVRHRLLHDVPALDEVLVHVDPCPHDGYDPHADTAHHASRLARPTVTA